MKDAQGNYLPGGIAHGPGYDPNAKPDPNDPEVVAPLEKLRKRFIDAVVPPGVSSDYAGHAFDVATRPAILNLADAERLLRELRKARPRK
jgi:hypothetical protein